MPRHISPLLRRFGVNKTTSPILLLVMAACVFMGGSALIFFELVDRQKVIMSAVEEDALWAAYQLDRESLKLKSTLKLLEDGYTEERLEEAKLRFDILFSRVNVLEAGELHVLFKRLPDYENLLLFLQQKMLEIEMLLYAEKEALIVPEILKKSDEMLKETGEIVHKTLASRSVEKVQQRKDALKLFIELGSLIALLTITMVFIIAMLFKQLKITQKSYGKSRKLTRDLELAVHSTKKALKIKTDFLATMSHEIRTPMNAIIGFSYLLQDDDLNKKQQEKVNKIQKSADNLLSIINSILDFSKIESGKVVLEEKVYSIDDVLDYVYSSCEVSANTKNIAFNVSRDFSLADQLVGDKTRLQQILINIVGNAIKFTHSGLVDVNLYQNSAQELVFEVKDTGVGIPEGVNVFDVFQQADSSTTRLYGGTGLGLSITDKLVELLGGKISFESTLGQGSTFKVRLPYRPDLNAQATAMERVGVIDQDKSIQELFSRLSVEYVALDITNALSNDSALVVDSGWFNNQDDLSDDVVAALKGRAIFISRENESVQDALVTGLLTPLNINNKSAILTSQDNFPLDQGKLKYEAELLNGKTILLAEDNKINANIVVAVLNKVGAKVDWVENGDLAFKKAQEYAYDLILMDIRMPIMDGYQASKEISQLLKDTKPPIVVLTADTFEMERKTNLEFGIDDFLFKPLDPHLLIEKIERWASAPNAKSVEIEYKSSYISEDTLNDIVAELDQLELLLMEGSLKSENCIDVFVKKYDGIIDMDALKAVIDDIASYDYQDAINKIVRFKQNLSARSDRK
ncbi:ATP-binding protein [Marinomonas sp. FW-1]|uniref:ATP-binding protein n=1 Tax=Marinomonas sp. FW-1 TaxID=2071621 RepID=UPI0010C04788|nr:ATP-binding protein [Marinomonas sp. FW-1]